MSPLVSLVHRGTCITRAVVLGLFLCLVGAVCASGQTAPSSTTPISEPDPGPWVPSFRSMGQHALKIARAPFELSPSQQLIALGTTGLVASTVTSLDGPAYRHLHTESGPASSVSHPLAAPGRWYDRAGPDRVILGTAGALALGGLVSNRRKWTRTSVRVVEAVVYTKILTGLAKSAINRSRPFTTSDPMTADPGRFSSAHSRLSMPSGHTARAFAVASVLAHQSDRWYVSLPSYGIAGSVALERVRSGDHWLTDVMVGGALGYFIGRAVSKPPTRDDVTYTPILSSDRIGVSVRF